MGQAQMQGEMVLKNKQGQRDRGAKHLAYQDLVDRQKKGLCFKCGGPYGPLHQCPVKQLRLILADDELQVECEEEDAFKDAQEEGYVILDGECRALSLQGMDDGKMGSHSTMKLQEKLSGIPILLLVDNGATHNFISRKLVEALGWTWEEAKSMNILMGDDHTTETRGMCKEIKIETEAGKFTLDAVLFDLEDIDVILGMSWLKTLGVMMVDWNTQIIILKMGCFL